jgi:hypothetical protein
MVSNFAHKSNFIDIFYIVLFEICLKYDHRICIHCPSMMGITEIMVLKFVWDFLKLIASGGLLTADA